MAEAWSVSALPDPYSTVALNTYISAATVQRRKEFTQVTSVLRDHSVLYKWGIPTKLVVTFQDQNANIFTPKNGIKRSFNWGLITSPPPAPKPQRPLTCIQDPWFTKHALSC